MQNPIIFLASQDPIFALTAAAAAINTRHLLRQGHSLKEATEFLADDTHNFALALIDTEPGFHGIDLLLGMASAKPNFPVLIIADAEDSRASAAPSAAWESVSRQATTEELTEAIRRACATNEVSAQ